MQRFVSINSNQQEKVTLAKSEAKQVSSTEKDSNIQFCLSILSILVPVNEGRKPKQAVTMHVQFTQGLDYTSNTI